MSQFITSIKEVTKNYKTYDGWEQEQANDEAKRKYLAKTLDLPKDKVELTTEKAKAVFRAADMMDKRSEDNCQNMERTTSIISTMILLPLIMMPSIVPLMAEKKGKTIANKTLNKLNLGMILSAVGLSVGIMLWGNGKQKEASRIGRFQAKQHELKDEKNFVIYTPKQIEAAKIIAKQMPNKKDSKGISEAFRAMKQMSKDKVEYKKWLDEKIKNPEDVKKILDAEFTPEQMKQGEEDKEIITNIVKDVNMKAEDYSEKTESVFDTLTILSFLGTIPLTVGINKILKHVKSIPKDMKVFVPFISGLTFALGMLGWSTNEKKNASRVGRYVKRQEILKDPESLIAYTPEQMERVKGVKAEKLKQGFIDKMSGNFSFLKTYLSDKKKYNHYLKTEVKDNEKLYDALKQTEISSEQLKDAKNLQKNTFRTFDKIDEMSQRYSEDTEAATELAKQGLGLAWDVAIFGGAILLGQRFVKGKIPIDKILNNVANLTLDKNSYLRKAANDLRNVLKSDKQLREKFNKTFAKDVISKIFAKEKVPQSAGKALSPKTEIPEIMQNEKIAKILNELEAKSLISLGGIKDTENPTKALREILKSQFKKGPVATWARNLVADIGKLKLKSKLKEEGIEVPDGLVGRKNYKTLLNTVLAGFAPVFAVLFAVPYAYSSWLANIQIKAGRIGIMKAMNGVDNAKLFVNQDADQKS